MKSKHRSQDSERVWILAFRGLEPSPTGFGTIIYLHIHYFNYKSSYTLLY